MTSPINAAFIRLTKRAEQHSRNKLVETFVNIGAFFTVLSNIDHQILYGRRGTGKTHAFTYLAESQKQQGNAVIYLDMRNIGSEGGIYGDPNRSLPRRATPLLRDVLNAIHDELLQYFYDHDDDFDLAQLTRPLDHLAEAITKVIVEGTTQQEQRTTTGVTATQGMSLEASTHLTDIKLAGNLTHTHEQNQATEERRTDSGSVRPHLHFGALRQSFEHIIQQIGDRRIWLLLDEWSSIPNDLQPYLADLLKRSVCPLRNMTIKIAAIEQRSRFRIPNADGDYIGFELGADIAADLNLDDYMVFDNDAQRAKQFYKELLYKHIQFGHMTNEQVPIPHSSDELVRQAFTQNNVFDEFVKATEGVPRDAINIITLAAQKAEEERISMDDIRTAAHKWYQRDKESTLKEHHDAYDLLHWIIDEVIKAKRARAFLIKNRNVNPLIDSLFDARLLHFLKRNISSKEEPGVRYDAYKIDYGCYVDLINTTHYPSHIWGADGNAIDVPDDDYRAIRRNILDIDAFLSRGNAPQVVQTALWERPNEA